MSRGRQSQERGPLRSRGSIGLVDCQGDGLSRGRDCHVGPAVPDRLAMTLCETVGQARGLTHRNDGFVPLAGLSPPRRHNGLRPDLIGACGISHTKESCRPRPHTRV